MRWTSRGAVSLPETLQIRTAPSPGALSAGAPVPGRAMREEELFANVRWFSRPGPRGRPVSGLVLSGLHEDYASLARAVAEGRSASIRQVTVHTDGGTLPSLLASPLAPLVDRLAVAVRTPEEIPDCRAISLPIDAIVPLEQSVLPLLATLARALSARAPRRVVFTWPFPGSGPRPAPAVEVVAALAPVLPELNGLPFSIKGIPACALPESVRAQEHIARSANRWYVDCSHQLEHALLFLPGVLAFSKREICRFCALDDRCDGVAEPWLSSGLVPPLAAIRA